jgi:hypothetical protein
LHFLFVLNFGYPLNKELKTKLDFYSFDYCYPYLFQDWRLFTPCPKYNFTICAKYKVNNTTHYALPLQEVLNKRNLFNGKEFLMLSITGSSGYAADDYKKVTESNIYFIINKNYAILRNVITNYLNHKHDEKISDLKMILILTDLKTKKQKTLIDK